MFPIRRRRRVFAATIATIFAFVVFAPAWLHARVQPPHGMHDVAAPTPLHFRTIRLDWVDTTRGRDVPARLFWPDAATHGPIPLVLFSHGIGSSDDGYTHLGRYWARHGIASLHVRHVGSDRTLWQGNVLGLLQRFRRAAGDDEAIARVQDLHFALDRVLVGRYGSRIDTNRIAVAGHSYGANSAMLLAGARVQRDGRVLQFGDARIGAAILISAPPFYGDADFGPILASVRIPTLHITTADDVIRIPGFASGVADREKVFAAMGGDKILALFDRGSHNVFTDRRYFDSAAVADSVKASTRELTLAFLRDVQGDVQGNRGIERFADVAAIAGPGLSVRSVRAPSGMDAVPRRAAAAGGAVAAVRAKPLVVARRQG